MSRRFLFIGVVALMVLTTGVLSAATPVPVTTIELVGDGLPAVMNVGETYTVTVHVTSDQQFISAQAMASAHYPGKGVVSVGAGDRAAQGTEATMQVDFVAKSTTERMENGVAPVSLVVGVRYGGGYVAVQSFDFLVQVP